MMDKKLFLHICCAPCSLYPVKKLQEEGFQLTGFFYNPNIHPLKEFKRRKETARQWAAKNKKLPMIFDDSYPLEEWLIKAIGAGNERCKNCYLDRMLKVAEEAKNRVFEMFSTTLLSSTQQKHEWLKEAGEEAARQIGIQFFYQDWREGWGWSEEESKKLEIYRQGYCGCVLSERDRYQKAPKEIPKQP